MKKIVVIPARYKSTRYPGKPLVPLLGKPMILWVAELAAKALGHDKVYVATEDTRILDIVESAGYNAIMTSENALTGTDRIAEVAEKIPADIYINVQGDEPLIDHADIIKICDKKIERMDCIVNGFCWIADQEDPENVNMPKVITNETGKMVYMSRKAIPGYKALEDAPSNYKKQVCIYAFTRDELKLFNDYGRKSELEACEDIEILRFLELDKQILMVETSGNSLAVDVPEDIAQVEEALKRVYGL